MGVGSSTKSKSKSRKPGELFAWFELTDKKHPCHYDPRFEDLEFASDRGEIVISAINNQVMRWTLNEDRMQFILNDPVLKYEHQRGSNVGRHFDRLGLSLAWTESAARLVYYYDFAGDDKKLIKLEVSEWLESAYPPGTTTWIPGKQMINFGSGIVGFLIGSRPETAQTGDPIEFHFCRFAVETGTCESQLKINYDFRNMQTIPEYWGFDYNEKMDCLSMLLKLKDDSTLRGYEKVAVMLVSCKTGDIIWQSIFDFVHDLSFNKEGTFMAVFERPKTSHGFVHVLNVQRQEWVCRVKLTYGGLPLGWDGFTWCGDSLVFIAPFKLEVLSEEEYLEKHSSAGFELKKGMLSEDGVLDAAAAAAGEVGLGLDEEEDIAEDPVKKAIDAAGSEEVKVTEEEASALGMTVDELAQRKRDELTLDQYRGLVEKTKRKEICVLGIGSRWWDVEPEIMELLSARTKDDNVSQLILSMAGLAWTIVQFGFPEIALESDDAGRTHASEVLHSGMISGKRWILLAKLGKDPRTGMYNHWRFYQTRIPNSFKEMWSVVNREDLARVKLGWVGSQDKEIEE